MPKQIKQTRALIERIFDYVHILAISNKKETEKVCTNGLFWQK